MQDNVLLTGFSGWWVLTSFALTTFIFALGGIYARKLGVDRKLIEGRWAGYDAEDLARIIHDYGESGVKSYRTRLIPLDALFASLLLISATLLAFWIAIVSQQAFFGLIAGGPLVAAGLLDLREGMMLRRLLYFNQPLDPRLVAQAAARTRLKLTFYGLGMITALLIILAVLFGWIISLSVTIAWITVQIIMWYRS